LRLKSHGSLQKVSGLGALLGLHFDKEVEGIAQSLLERGWLLGRNADPRCLSFAPPLILSDESLGAACDELLRA